MNQSDILEQIKLLLTTAEKAVVEIQNGNNPKFYSALIQKNSLELFNLANQIELGQIQTIEKEIAKQLQSIPEEIKPTIEIKLPEVVPVIPEPIKETIVVQEIEPIEIPKQDSKINESFIEHIEKTVQKTTVDENIIKSTSKSIAPKPLISLEEDGDDEISINEKISKGKKPVLNYADKSSETNITDLSKAISIGKKFEFINGLFDGNSEHYKNSIQILQHSENYQSAINHIESDITNKYDWNDNEKLAAEFFALIRRRFN